MQIFIGYSMSDDKAKRCINLSLKKQKLPINKVRGEGGGVNINN